MITDTTVGVTVDEFLAHAIDGEGNAGVRLALDLLDRGLPSDAVITDLLGAAQREVGEHWWRDEWTVADEHLVSGVTQKALDALADAIHLPTPHGSVVVACAEGDWHALPAQMFAEQLRSHGFAVVFLGASTPADHVATLLRRRRPDALAVSCNLPLYFAGLARLADAAHREGVPTLAGGRALGRAPQQAIRLGADGWAAKITDAVAVLEAWQDRAPQFSGEPTRLQPAALLLDANARSIADAAVRGLIAEYPRMASYNDHQLARTHEDLAYIVQFLAAARLADDPEIFTEFLEWLRGLLAHRGVAPVAVDSALRVLAPFVRKIDVRAAQLTLAACQTG